MEFMSWGQTNKTRRLLAQDLIVEPDKCRICGRKARRLNADRVCGQPTCLAQSIESGG